MPAIYDRIERCWRAEDDQGQIAGYYTTEATALAALQRTEQADSDDDFLAVIQFIDLLADLHDAAAPAVTLKRDQYTDEATGAPISQPFIEATCGGATLILDNPDRLPSENPLEGPHLALLIDGTEIDVDSEILSDLRRLLESPEAAQLLAMHEA